MLGKKVDVDYYINAYFIPKNGKNSRNGILKSVLRVLNSVRICGKIIINELINFCRCPQVLTVSIDPKGMKIL